jgi:hypothetical protein
MAYDRTWLVDTLKRLGYPDEAEKAEQLLPEHPTQEQVKAFADKHDVFLDQMIDRMGGSP